MGSEGSKSSKCSPGHSNIEKSEIWWNAGNDEAQEVLEGYQFKKVACWARALEGKAGIETGRAFVGVFTFGLSEISRATVGGTNHWAFVAWGTQTHKPDIFFVAQFGDGDGIPSLKRMTVQMAAQTFNGVIVSSIENAVKMMNTNSNDMDTWVVRGDDTSGWKYPCEDGSFRAASDLPWKTCSSKTVAEMNSLVYQTKSSENEYSHMSNNCQHFADELYSLSIA